MLAKAVKERPFGWEDHLQRLCLAYNTSVNQTTGYSPFYLMFGRQVRMPIDLMYGCPDTHTVTVPQYVADLCASRRKAYENVMECMESKLDRQKEYYDQRVHGEPYNKGDLVWLHNPAVRSRSRKLHCPWTGLYRIVSRLSDAVCRIQHAQVCRKRLVVHFNRLKPCPRDIRLPTTTPLNQRQQCVSDTTAWALT